jgi:hypothetical protein
MGSKNDTAPKGLKNAVKLEDLCAAWAHANLHLTSRRYRQMAKEGCVDEPVKGYVDAIKTLCQVAAYYQGMASGRGDSSHEEEKKLKTREERLIKEMERKTMEGNLMERSTVADELTRRVHVLKADLLAISKRLAKWPEAKETVEKQVRHLMRTYSRKTGVFSD